MATQRITIIGTGCIGTSMGLALRSSKDRDNLEIVGHDRELNRAQRGRRAGAFDRAELNLDIALRDARLVIVAVPLASLREALRDVGRLIEAESGTVVTDTAHLKGPVIEWAEKALPDGVHFVGGDPFLAPEAGWEVGCGPENARADLFEAAVYAITAGVEDHPSAVRAIANLARTLGAEPLFMDPQEHDTARALMQALPDLTATALLQVIKGAPGWQQARKAADRSFATATAAASGDAASRRMAVLLQRDALLRGMDGLIARLESLRELVARAEGEALEAALTRAAEDRTRWIAAARSRTWESELGGMGEGNVLSRTLQTVLGGALGRRSDI